ncbi:hypothetical protein CBR_g49935 [Chara braunii]|uniref:Integrase catalytic domain-containing protein n=1 Tax=Chara braunii TaxID=69332 RepID=A0A388JPC6_CHABU|nr:hypothetical protein CBR_g49935 [Chara braunii]|eukprot:GBG59670.1 hypothetical protein CBR_g49935 [Chara braunii]
MGHGSVDFLEGLVAGSSREGISNAVTFVGGMANGECELGKEVEPLSLAWGDVFLGEDGRNDGVVSVDGEVLPVEVRAPDCEGVNHSEEFLLVGGVIHLRGTELLACEGDGVFAGWNLGVSGRVLDGGGLDGVAGEMLGQYGFNGEVGGISGDIEMASGVGDLEDRGRGDGLLEEVESVLAAIVPIEGLVLACEFVDKVRDLGEVANEWAVIVGKAEEGTELKEGLGRGVLDEGCDLRGVHTDAFSGDNVAKVFDARSGKRTFAELDVEFLLSEDREDLANVLKVGLEGGGKDEDVIKAGFADTGFGDEVAGGTNIKDDPELHRRYAKRDSDKAGTCAVPAQAEVIMALRRRCSKPNLTSRSCRACSSTRSEKAVEKGLEMRDIEIRRAGASGKLDRRDSRRRREGGRRSRLCRLGVARWDFLETAGWRGRRWSGGTILAFHPHKVGGLKVLNGELGGVERGNVEVVIGGGWSGVVRGDVMEEAGAGGSGRGLVMGVEESIVVKHAKEEVSKGHVGFVGEGGCKIFVAYSVDAGDERKVGNDGGGEVMAEGADVLDEAVRGIGLMEVTKLFEVVIDGFLGAEGGSEKVGPLEEGVTPSFGGAAVADFDHPPFGGIVEEAGGGNGKPVDKGHVVEFERVLEPGKEEENVLVGKAGEGHDVDGSEGTRDFPFAGNNPGEGVEVEVIGGSVVAGVIKLVVVVKEVVGGKLWHCGVNPGGYLGIGGTGGGDGGDVVGVEEVGGGVWLEAAVDVGVVVVSTWMEGVVVWDSRAVNWLEMPAMEVESVRRESCTDRRMERRDGAGVFSPMACWPTSSRWISATESSRRELMLRLEAPSTIGEDEGEVAEEDGAVEVVAADVIAEAVAAAASTATHWEVLVWRGGMWRRGGQFLFTRVESREVFIHHETTFKAFDKKIATLQAEVSTLHAANSQQQTINGQLQNDVSTGLARLSAAASTGSAVADCSPALAAQAKQLEAQINHVVAALGNISKFAGASTVSNQLQTLSNLIQQRPAVIAKEWKMSNFKIEKFDDYHKTDPLQWWMAFNAEADIHHTPPLRRLDALYLQLIGGAQAFMMHLAVTLECTIATLHSKITTLKTPKGKTKGETSVSGWSTTGTMDKVQHYRRHVQVATEMGMLFLVQQHQTHHQRMPRQGQGKCQASKLGKLSTAGSAATSLPNPSEPAASLAVSLTSGDDAVVASSHIDFENYAVELVPPLKKPLRVQDSSACAVVPLSDNEPVASPALLSEDPSLWASLEELDPLTVEDFQWLPLPSTVFLPTPHCNALMTHLREYLHAAVPPPSTDSGVAVVDLRNYLAKIDREHAIQRYVDIDAPLLYIRIQIRKATCSALIDCGASRNYISQDFMARAGLGPRFDMILGMSWLQSEDHPVNFYRRTVHVRDRRGELVPCTVSLPHPSIGCHVVSAVSIRQCIRRSDIEEMGICFLHALPPGDQPKTDTSDPRIIELFDSYEDVFQAPAGVVPDQPTRHGITLEDGVVPPCGCIYRMREEELQVLRAQLDDLLAKGWIRPSCSPYGAPVLFVWKKNKDLRLCIDYRKLNGQTIKNVGPLPWIDDLLERLGGAKYFSKLDPKSGYHQIEIQPRDWYKTAYKTRHGHPEWFVMPFGLTNALATFQAAMTTEFRDLLDHTVVIYLDDILSPLVPFEFNDEARHVFHTLKTTVLQAPVLSIYDPTLPTKVTTDASGYDIGAVLEQHDDTDWYPFEYFSQKVPPINTLDDARKKELLAFVTVLKRWRHFLLGRRRFTWATDNNPLTYYKTQDTVSSTIGRWMYFIDQFDFTSKHISGSLNKAADALSRKPDLCALVHSTFGLDEDLQQHFVNGYKSDPGFSALYADLSLDHPSTSNRIVDGYLLLHTRGKDLLCVPQDRVLRTRLLGEYHDSRLAGHLGVARTLARLRQRFHWPDIISDVNRYIQSCAVYHRNKGLHQLLYDERKPLSIPQEPGLSIATDVTGPFPRDRLGHDGILTVVDRLSKYARFLPCKYHATAPELARLLHTGWFCSHGVSEDIVSNRDTRFMSAFWTAVMVESGTSMKPSSTRHPQTDGQTERAHQTAQMMLRTLIHPDEKDWVDHLPDIEFAYNTLVHPAIGVTPFELHHSGRKGRIFADILLPRAVDIDATCSPASTPNERCKLGSVKYRILVRYRGALPDLFREGHSIVAEGFLKPIPAGGMIVPGGDVAVGVRGGYREDEIASTDLGERAKKDCGCYFAASEVLAKHDEKYMPKEVAAALAKNREAKEAAAAAKPGVSDSEDPQRHLPDALGMPVTSSVSASSPRSSSEKDSKGTKSDSLRPPPSSGRVAQAPAQPHGYELRLPSSVQLESSRDN